MPCANSSTCTPAVAILCTLPLLQAAGFGLCDYDDGYHLVEQAFLKLPPARALAAALTEPQYHLYSPVYAVGNLLDSWVHAALGRGPGAVYSHLVNLSLHLGSCLLLLRLGRRLSPGARWATLLGVMLFAWHPVRVEPVVWITARKDLLVGFFSLAAITVAAGSGPGAWSRQRHLAFWGLGALALLSKPTAAFLPLLALVWPLWFPEVGWRRLAWRFGPVALAAALVVGLNLAVKLATLDVLRPYGHDVLTRVWLPLYTLGHHLAGLLWPHDLTPFRLVGARSFTDPLFLVGLAALAGLGGLLLWVRRGGEGGGVRVEVGLGLAALLACLPVINLIPNTPHRQLVDSYMYAPSMFASLALGVLLARLGRRLRPALAWGAAGCLLLTLGLLTLVQVRSWSSGEALYARGIELSPANTRPYFGLSNLHMRQRQRQAAMNVLLQGLEVLPGQPLLRNNMAVIFSTAGRWEQAREILAKLKPETHPVIMYNHGILALRQGDMRTGRALLERLTGTRDLGAMAREALAAARRLSREAATPPHKDPALFLRAVRAEI